MKRKIELPKIRTAAKAEAALEMVAAQKKYRLTVSDVVRNCLWCKRARKHWLTYNDPVPGCICGATPEAAVAKWVEQHGRKK